VALGTELILLGMLLCLSWVGARVAARIGIPAIPIYMLVGVLFSKSFGWFPLSVGYTHTVELLGVFGLVLLLFNLGLEFDQDAFYSNAGTLILAGGSYVVLNMGVGLLFGFWVGWGAREALIIAGMTATSSSAIVTKLLIELKRLPNRETPMVLGVTVIEDITIALYLAVVGVALSGTTNPWAVAGELTVAFLFIAGMFMLARYAGRVIGAVLHTRDSELLTVLFFGLVLMFAGIGEHLGVTDAIGAFLVGLLLGATRLRGTVERVAIPMRDVFGAFFFIGFGLSLDVTKFGPVLWPVCLAVVMTVGINLIAGQLVARLQRLGIRAGLNAGAILLNRGEFALILAAIAAAAGLDARVVSFGGLYVLVMAVLGPVLTRLSDRVGRRMARRRGRMRAVGDGGLVE
jgi:CPA2 family monovalent cation:H+ antiporter-2